jgi:hypothetical protein
MKRLKQETNFILRTDRINKKFNGRKIWFSEQCLLNKKLSACSKKNINRTDWDICFVVIN